MSAQQRIQQQSAWILHSRAFKETSLILDCLTQEHGRISVIAKGVRGSKKSQRGLLQPFQPLLINYSGKADLKTLTGVDTGGAAVKLIGDALYAGFYVNELLIRLLPQAEAFPTVFTHYLHCVHQLAGDYWRVALREFELQLLDELGYGLQLNATVDGVAIQAQQHYDYHVEHGIVDTMPNRGPSAALNNHGYKVAVSGTTLLALANGQVADADAQETARLMKTCLAYYLGPKPLQSRELWKSIKQTG